MLKVLRIIVSISFVSSFLTGCLEGEHEGVGQEELCVNIPETGQCHAIGTYKVFVEDSYEREKVINSPEEFDFGWREIINDNGTIIDGSSGNNVEVKIYDGQVLGPAFHEDKALYFRGRQGRSVHNIYLVSKTFDISEGQGGIISFKYLLMDLEPGEFLKLEICNDDVDACGVGEELSIEGLNSAAWETVFEVGPESDGNGLNGLNHSLADWQYAQVNLFLENYPKSEFTFRFNVRMDEGFIGNDINNGMEDGVAIDDVRGTSFVDLGFEF